MVYIAPIGGVLVVFNHELLVAQNGGVVAPPNGEPVPTYSVYIVPWAPTMDIDTSTASSALLIVEI